MKTFVAGLAAGILVGTPIAVAHTDSHPAGGIRIYDQQRGVLYQAQQPDRIARVTFSGPVQIERHGPFTTVRTNFAHQTDWVTITLDPIGPHN